MEDFSFFFLTGLNEAEMKRSKHEKPGYPREKGEVWE